MTIRKKKESHPKVSCRRSLSCSLRGHLVLSTTSRGSPRPAGSGFSTVGVGSCGSSGSPSWSGMGATGVSGPVYSSGMLSSTSKEDCSWILSSKTHREGGRHGWGPGEGSGSWSGWKSTWQKDGDGLLNRLPQQVIQSKHPVRFHLLLPQNLLHLHDACCSSQKFQEPGRWRIKKNLNSPHPGS